MIFITVKYYFFAAIFLNKYLISGELSTVKNPFILKSGYVKRVFFMKCKKILLSVFALLFLCSNSFAADYVGTKLEEIEKYFYGYTNKGSDISRVARVEKDLYGQTSSQSLKNRVDKIYKDMNLGGATGAAASLNQSYVPEEEPMTKDIGPQAEAGIKYPVVDKLEQKVFKKAYENDDIYDRLARLEKQVFPKDFAQKSTLSLNERVDALRDKLLGGSQLAAVDIDPMREEIILENGQKYMGDNDTQYNYYSYEGSKNHIAQPSPSFDSPYSSYPDSSAFDDETVGYAQNYDLDVLEKQLFGKRFAQEPPSKRLARLESNLFQRTFSDNDEARIQRLLAVTTAQKTSQEYDSNKWARRLNAGIQIGSILLMVLAMIL